MYLARACLVHVLRQLSSTNQYLYVSSISLVQQYRSTCMCCFWIWLLLFFSRPSKFVSGTSCKTRSSEPGFSPYFCLWHTFFMPVVARS